MAYYEYLCVVSGEEFEAEHSIKIVLEDCPLCKVAGREPHSPKRLISLGGKGVVEQSFQDLKASMPNEVAKFKRELNNNPNKFANFIGEERFHQNELARTKK